MADQLEQQLEGSLEAAQQNAWDAEAKLNEAHEEGEKVMEKARAARQKLVEGAAGEARVAREDLRRIEKMLKLYHGEPLNTPQKPKTNGELPEELVTRVGAEIRRLVEADEYGDGGVSRAQVAKHFEGIGDNTIGEAIEVLRGRHEIRRAGKRRTGPLYKLWAGEEAVS